MLKPGEKYHSWVTMSVHLGKDGVQKVMDQVEKICKGVSPKIFRRPLEEFSPI